MYKEGQWSVWKLFVSNMFSLYMWLYVNIQEWWTCVWAIKSEPAWYKLIALHFGGGLIYMYIMFNQLSSHEKYKCVCKNENNL